MQTNLFWKKDFFTSTYSILTGSQFAGKLINSYFGKTAHVEAGGKSYRFVTKGLIDQRTLMIDTTDGHWVGEIRYSSLVKSANIILHDTLYFWKFDNILNTHASIVGPNNTYIKYDIASTSGIINSNTDDAILGMAGLYVADFYMQKTILRVTLLAIFIASMFLMH